MTVVKAAAAGIEMETPLAATALLVKVHTPVAEGARVAGSLDRGSVRAHDSGTAGAQQAYLLADAG